MGAQRGLTGGVCHSDLFGTWKRVRVVLEQLVLARLQQRVPATVRVVDSASIESVAAWLVGLQPLPLPCPCIQDLPRPDSRPNT